MSLVVAACPQSESQLAVMQCALEARGVHFFVQGGGFGSLLPGPQIAAYNARRIMVPSSEVSLAKEALEPLLKIHAETEFQRPRLLSIFRMICELFLFGWFVPAKRKITQAESNDSSKRTR